MPACGVIMITGDHPRTAARIATDLGIAMGVTGTDVTKEAAKMILADDNFATIVAAVREGRAIFANIRKFLRYLLSSNIGEVLTMFLGVVGASLIGLDTAGGTVVAPLLATQILWINLLTDTGPALAMGVDPPPGDVMRRPPRKLTDRVIDRQMQLGVLLVGLVMALVTLLTIDLKLPGGLHRAGAGPALQLLQLALGPGQRLPGPVRQPLAVGGDRAVAAAPGARGARAAAQPGLWHRAPVGGRLGAVHGHGQRRVVGRRAEEAAGAPATPSALVNRRST
jgi:Cation transporting ATPase, C-terminus